MCLPWRETTSNNTIKFFYTVPVPTVNNCSQLNWLIVMTEPLSVMLTETKILIIFPKFFHSCFNLANIEVFFLRSCPLKVLTALTPRKQ